MIENDDEMPPQENLINNEKRFNTCINQQTYQLINQKKNQFNILKKQRDNLLINFEETYRLIFQKNELLSNINNKKSNLNYLRDELSQSASKIKQNQESLNEIKKRIIKKRLAMNNYIDKIEKCKDMLKKSEITTLNKTNNEKDGFNILKLRLIEYEKQRIDQLNKFVFDLIEIKQKEEDILQKSTRTALKDARQTVYVNGRWILANDHVIYRIVRSNLPTDGDYLSYFKDSQQKDDKLKDETQQLEDIDRHYYNQMSPTNRNKNPNLWINSPNSSPSSSSFSSSGYLSNSQINSSNRSIDRRTILSGLTYTVQFVNLIAFYLNILLPYNIPHNKFCTQSLTDDQFQNSVAKLNTNIVYLSIIQHIPVSNLLPKQTLENLHHFLTYFREMRIKLRDRHPISFPDHMIPLLDEMFTDSEEDNQMQDSIPNLLFSNDNEEWETVPNSNEIPSDDTFNATPSRNVSSSLISSVLSQFWYKNSQAK